MGRLSLLPESLHIIESAVSWLFFALAVITIGPWLLVFLYDILLYAWRSVTFDIPYIGGAARGKQRPRAPSLAKRPDGHRRRFSLAALSVDLKPVDVIRSTILEEDNEDAALADERNDSVMGEGSPVEYRKRKSQNAVQPEHDYAVHD
ncbi:hypothetical protein ANO11243_089920 [Dothideomycetidae sp. 11243]|nr:hypothetical protein ANO11243_089920 [fungal sp. No.11243]